MSDSNHLGAVIGPDAGDPELAALVGDLSARSADFRRLWARQEVRTKGSGTARIRHPQAGNLELTYEKLAVQGTSGQLLIIYHAEPDSVTEQRLRLLETLAVAPRHPQSQTTAAHH